MNNVDQSIFKAYDIRGIYPSSLNEEVAQGVVRAYVSILQPETVVVGRDGRISGPALRDVVVDTFIKAGVNVIDVGVVSTDMYYYACATKKLPGIMITASHNPKEYNGFKMVKQIPYLFTGDNEIKQIKEMVVADSYPNYSEGNEVGQVTKWDLMEEFIDKLVSIVDPNRFAPFTLMIDTANGMVGPIVNALSKRMPMVKITPMYFEPDGNFPNHGGDPLLAENRQELQTRITKEEADLGAMFDPDGDRFFVIDKKGRFISGDFMTAILSEDFLGKHKGASIVYDIRASLVVPDTINKLGGKPLYNRVGHAYIKRRMMDEKAVFGGEVTGHYYFADFYYCDSGILTLLVLLDYLSQSTKSLDQIVDDMESRYHISGEINNKVASVPDVLDRIESHYHDSAKEILKVDGVSVEFEDWRFNVRGSNTEPLIRLNLEAKSKQLMEQKRDEVLALITA